MQEMIRLHDTRLQILRRSRLTDQSLKTIAARIAVEHYEELEELRRLQP